MGQTLPQSGACAGSFQGVLADPLGKMMLDFNQIAWPWFIGAFYDIFGALLLARSFLAVTSQRLITQSSAGFGGFSAPLLRLFCEQKVDAQFAAVSLVLGFSLQAISALGVNIKEAWTVLLLFGVLMVAIAAYFGTRRWIIERYLRAALRTRFSSDAEVEQQVANSL
jgi:hypothetical protein